MRLRLRIRHVLCDHLLSMAFRLRCKFCCAEVADSRERRCLHATSSEEVQSALRKVLVGKGCSEAAAKQHFESGYVCKKCFLLVKKYNRLVMDIKEVKKEMEKTINSTAAEFNLHCDHDDEEESLSRQQPSKRQGAALATPTAKRARRLDFFYPSVSVCSITTITVV